MELETHFLIANRLGYLTSEKLNPLLTSTGEVSRMLCGLTKSLKNRLAGAQHKRPEVADEAYSQEPRT